MRTSDQLQLITRGQGGAWPLGLWPEADRKAWNAACQPAARLKPGGRAGHLSPVTREDHAQQYGYYLGFLARHGLLELDGPAAANVTAAKVHAYVVELKTHVSSMTLHSRIRRLRRAAQYMAPNRDLTWLAEIGKDLAPVARPRSKFDRLVLAEVLVEAGLKLINEAERSAKITPLARACRVRNGLMVALLGFCPIRRKNFGELEIGRSFVKIRGQWWIVLSAAETKEKRADERRVNELLTPIIDRYISEYRPVLARSATEALRQLGWVEGENVVFERRFAENRLERLPELAADLVRLKVDVISAGGTLAPLAAKRATSTIPIVMTSAGDPLGSGLVASLAQPGGNVTGMSLMGPDLGGKRLELLKELLPGLARVAVLWNAATPNSAVVLKEVQEAGRRLGIEVQSLEVRGPDEFDGGFEAARKQHPDAMITAEDPLTLSYRKRIAIFATGQHLPSVSGLSEFVEAGGLMSYGANLDDLYRRAAGYVDKILKGANPADLPVQQPTKFDLVINLTTAKALGLTVPPSLLARADEVIE